MAVLCCAVLQFGMKGSIDAGNGINGVVNGAAGTVDHIASIGNTIILVVPRPRLRC